MATLNLNNFFAKESSAVTAASRAVSSASSITSLNSLAAKELIGLPAPDHKKSQKVDAAKYFFSSKVFKMATGQRPNDRFFSSGPRIVARLSNLLCFEDPDNSDDVLPADGALSQLLAAVGAGGHVAALQHDAIDGRVPTNLAQVGILHRVLL